MPRRLTGGDAGSPAAIAETHSAVVFFVGDRALKLKKPVDLGLLDFRDRTARAAACAREVELNRRRAPDVYLAWPTWWRRTASCATTSWSCGACRPVAGSRRWSPAAPMSARRCAGWPAWSPRSTPGPSGVRGRPGRGP